jgi:GDPmannose 4,6-dehydratase
MKTALITGITGQDGSYLAELLLEKGYEVHGIIRRSSSFNTGRINHIFDKLHLHHGDLTDSMSLTTIIQNVMPDEIYNLGAQSHVKVSFEMPEYTANVDALGTMRLLEIIRGSHIKLYQASTSEMFGNTEVLPQTETTPFQPVSPYGIAKVYAYQMTKMYREAYGVYACSGILFNHESPRRGETFVTRKIVKGLSAISAGVQDHLTLGNLYSLRDWGHAKDYVKAMWLMLQQDQPQDYVIATGMQYSVKDFVNVASPYFGIFLEWRGHGTKEIGVDKRTGKTIIRIDEKYFRPKEVHSLLGYAGKAKQDLDWRPEISFKELVEDMCIHGQ